MSKVWNVIMLSDTAMKDNNISRRSFIRISSLAAGAIAIAGCTKPATESNEPAHKQPGDMTKRTNPNTGDSVSVLGYGCMRLPVVDADSGVIDQEAVNEQVDYALEHGVNYFDSSPMYCKGKSEEAMGIALSRHPRDSYYIATKLSNFAPESQSAEASEAMFRRSLELFKTDYIDYYLLHSVGNGGLENMHRRYFDNGMIDFMKEQRAKGVIRNLGFSFHGDIACFNELLEMHDRGDIHWDFVQIQLNYINWEHPAEDNGITAEWLYNELVRRQIPAVIMEPLLGGRLANVPATVFTKMKERRSDESVASWAFRFAAMPGVLTVLSGMTYMEHVKDNIATYSPLQDIDEDEHLFLMTSAAAIVENGEIPCTACAYCMPCPYGVDIPGNFAHFNKCIADDNMPHDRRDPDYARARRAYLVSYDRSVERMRQADRCIACGSCLSACPQSIDIPAQLARVDKYTEQLKQNKA